MLSSAKKESPKTNTSRENALIAILVIAHAQEFIWLLSMLRSRKFDRLVIDLL